MKYNIGDKFVIEIENIALSHGEPLYRIKGFNTLVFDDNGLDKLKKVDDTLLTQKFEIGDEITYGSDSIEGYILNPNYSEDELVASMENTACPQRLYKKECYKTGKKNNNIKKLLGL